MIVRKELVWNKPMLVFKGFGHQIHLMVQKEAKRCGIEFMGGPQGQVVRLDSREGEPNLVLIKDIEQGTQYSPSLWRLIWSSVWYKMVCVWNWRRVLSIKRAKLFV